MTESILINSMSIKDHYIHWHVFAGLSPGNARHRARMCQVNKCVVQNTIAFKLVHVLQLLALKLWIDYKMFQVITVNSLINLNRAYSERLSREGAQFISR